MPTEKRRGCLGTVWNLFWKAIVAIVGLLIVVIIGTAIFSPAKPTMSIEATTSPVVLIPTAPSTVTPLPTVTLSPDAQIRAVLGDSNRNVARVAKVELVADVINIEWAINDNLTEDMIKAKARMDAVALLKTVHSSGLPFGLINLTGTFSLRDQFGKTDETPVVWLTYSSDTMSKINWEDTASKQ